MKKTLANIYGPWLFCQTGQFKGMIRWQMYVEYRNGKSARHNGIRRQNIADHTLSKLVAVNMLLPELVRIFGNAVDFLLLLRCITFHDFGEPLRKKKGEKKNKRFDIMAHNKKDLHDAEEYELFMKFLRDSKVPKQMIKEIELAFLLQFSLTSYESFPLRAQKIMSYIRNDEVLALTAILFQIIEKWEYHFYAYEHDKKHPDIWKNVTENQGPLIEKWMNAIPVKYHRRMRTKLLT